jgi:L-cysteine/cystine lyase
LAAVDPSALRPAFPVLERIAYLNAGSDGPVPSASVDAARDELEREARDGRVPAHFKRRLDLLGQLRERYAALLGAPAEDVSVTTSTSEGMAAVLVGLDLRPGDEIVTSDSEHPGLIGPLIHAREVRGAKVRAVALADVADAVGPETRLVACSHVSWITGELAPAALAQLDVPVVLDGAQGVGAVPVDVAVLGCAAYAGPGQKWLCGPDGLGMLHVTPAFRERIAPTRPGYMALADSGAGLESGFKDGAQRFDVFLPAAPAAAGLAALDVLEAAGWDGILTRGPQLAGRLADALREAGREVLPRGDSTLVAWRDADAEATASRLAERGIAVRHLPGRDAVRASVGAWNDESDLERLLGALGAPT